jgi:peroxiredoxin Q/BCP
MNIRSLAAGIIALVSLAGSASALDVGARVPDFEFQGVDGAMVRWADMMGKRGVVIAWFPKAFTPG